MNAFINNMNVSGNNSFNLMEILNTAGTGNDDILKIIEIIAAILVPVIGAFAAYRFTCGRSAGDSEISSEVDDRELDTRLKKAGGDDLEVGRGGGYLEDGDAEA